MQINSQLFFTVDACTRTISKIKFSLFSLYFSTICWGVLRKHTAYWRWISTRIVYLFCWSPHCLNSVLLCLWRWVCFYWFSYIKSTNFSVCDHLSFGLLSLLVWTCARQHCCTVHSIFDNFNINTSKFNSTAAITLYSFCTCIVQYETLFDRTRKATGDWLINV